jgi:FKBP-type peptidyl-prolyl cis-trans isomerase
MLSILPGNAGQAGLYVPVSLFFIIMERKMTKKLVVAVLLSAAVGLACYAGGGSDKSGGTQAQTGNAAAAPAASSGTALDADTSYAFGMILAESLNLKILDLNFDYEALSQGIKDTIEWNTPRISMEEAFPMAQNTAMGALERIETENKVKEEQFLAENGKKAGIVTTASGLQYRIDKAGNGTKAGDTDTVSVHYEGSFLNGKVFDSSYTRNEPMEVPLGEAQLIQGYLEGLRLMDVGSVYTFYIPADLAYGPDGARGAMPPNATLIFKIEFLSIANNG